MVKRPQPLNQRKSNNLSCFFVILCALLAAALLFDLWFVRRYFVVEVSGGSMENTLFDGDMLYADRAVEPQRGDIVIIDVSPYQEDGVFRGDFIIKRLIALEGDSIQCKGNILYLKKAGEDKYSRLEEPYTDFPTRDFGEVTVGEGEIFFLGDHRNNSTDSRVEGVGCLKLSDVVGVVPEWSVKYRKIIGAWEQFRSLFSGRTKTEE